MKRFITAILIACCMQLNADCFEREYNSCQESLDYDYTTEEQQIDNEIECEELSKDYCDGRITLAEFEHNKLRLTSL